MAATPNLDQLKEGCGYDALQKCFKFFFMQQMTEEEGFIQKVGEECNELRRKIEKLEEYVRELETLGPFHEVGGEILDCINEMLERERGRLVFLVFVLAEAMEGMAENQRHVTVMDFTD